MPRAERPLDEGDSALLQFARDLRSLRDKAGKPTYRELSVRAHYSEAALSQAAAGRKLPSLAVTVAYVRACGGSADEWEERWREVAAELIGPEPGEQGEAPYVGLAPFQPEDAHRFFGRERLVEEVLSRLAHQRVVVLFGASGSGKSSVLRAGVLRRLTCLTLLLTPGARPLEECAIRLARLTGAASVPRLTFPRAVHQEIRRGLPDGQELVIVVDQFEELFTMCRDPDERHCFIAELLLAAEEGSCRVVLGVRADFYAHCTAFPKLLPALRDGHVTLGPMTRDELRQAIIQPASRSGCAVETALVTELIAQARGEVGILPLLSHALLETWRRRRGNALTLGDYRAAGGLEHALARTAESIYDGLSGHQRDLIRNLMVRLTALGESTEDTKRRIGRDELDDTRDTRQMLERLAAARLIALDRGHVEISHEALIGAWPRLRGWLTEDREGLLLHRQLTEATATWQSLDHDADSLYRGVRLARTREWATRHPSALTEREWNFLNAGLAAEQAAHGLTRRRTRRLRQSVAVLSLLLVVAVVTTTYAIRAEQDAARQRNTALAQIVIGKAAALRKHDPVLAAQLSLAAYRLSPTDQTKTAVLTAIPLSYTRRLSGHTANVNTVAYNGRTVLTASHDRSARLWTVADPTRPRTTATLSAHEGNVNAAAFRPDGRVLATASWDRTARLWSTTDPRHPLANLGRHAREVNAVAFNDDGRLAATGSSDSTAKLWDVSNPRSPRPLTTLTGHANVVVAVAFQPRGDLLATAAFDHTVGLWDLTGRRAPAFLTGHQAPVTWVAFSSDGTTMASASQDSTVRVWDVVRRRTVATLAGHDRIVRSVAFSPDTRLIATASEDGTARLWHTPYYRPAAILEAHTQPVVSVAFSPDGRTLATASDDDTVILWSIPPGWPTNTAQADAWICAAVTAPISHKTWTTYFPGLPYQPPCP
ncbi:hypothetical protein AB0K48_34425 [Nonomuraea sp. NPDC055795]